LKPERKLWQELKKKTPNIYWTRIENLAVPGVPDLLGYNKNHFFFTVELKVSSGNKIRLSPHQIGFHTTHPQNSFILVKSLASRGKKLSEYFLYEGSSCSSLAACGLKLAARCSGLEACCSFFEKLGA
jgi:hypothetical protein